MPKPATRMAAKKSVRKKPSGKAKQGGSAPRSRVATPPVAAQAGEISTLDKRFCAEYVRNGGNGTQAYLAARPEVSEGSARTMAARLLAKVHVKQEIATLAEKVSQRAEITAAKVVQTAWDMMTADAREFCELHVGCCRNCWGRGFRWQRTDGELADARAAHQAKRLELSGKALAKLGQFDEQGGGGFDARREPNEQCPTCGGAGNPRTVFKDTRKLSPGAAQLFAGVKETDKGLEVKTHSKDAAVDKLMRHFGLYRDKIELTMPTVLVRDLTGRKDAPA
ncbi:terminase small subunit [Ramlibacter sp.]|uniref:terminase small subunit n=1 Tax=Ramlibacter sp. TaxID=1917967 RepID=UPI003D102F9B